MPNEPEVGDAAKDHSSDSGPDQPVSLPSPQPLSMEAGQTPSEDSSPEPLRPADPSPHDSPASAATGAPGGDETASGPAQDGLGRGALVPASGSGGGSVEHPREGEAGGEDEGSEEEDEGGPVMSFLDHLEALRWTLIKSGASVLIAMVACLVAANRLVEILVWPLEKAQQELLRREKVVVFQVGDTVLWKLRGEEAAGWPVMQGTNRSVFYNLVPRLVGSNYVWVIEPETDPEARASVSTISLKNYTPLGPFAVALQLALYGGLGLASPFVFYFVGQFVVPAMRKSEKRMLFPALAVGTVLFLLGVAFCYLVMVQIALNAAVLFSRWMSFGADEWRAEEYIGFVCKFMLGMGLAFELPVVILTLVKIGLLDYRKLVKFRPYWIVVNLLLSSILTPPDPVSMVMMALPLQFLYEISVLIARYWGRREEEG